MKTKIIYIPSNTKFDTSNLRDCYSGRMFTLPSVVNLGFTVNVSSANEESGFAVKDALSHVRDSFITENLILHSQDVPYNVVAFFSNIEKFSCLLVNDLGRESLNSSNFCFHDASSWVSIIQLNIIIGSHVLCSNGIFTIILGIKDNNLEAEYDSFVKS